MKSTAGAVISVLLLILAACDPGPNSGRGFSLPEGNAERGREAFLALQCNACHSVGDIVQMEGTEDSGISVKLGGPVTSIKSYGDLVTSVINPSHRISRRYNKQDVATDDGSSKMLVYNDVMTVQQLVDLVTFLESNYKLIRFDRTAYPNYRVDF